MKKNLLPIAALFFINSLLAQPANDNPCGAVPITIFESSDPCTPQPYTITGATYLNLTIPNACSNINPDVWYSFTPNRYTVYITLATSAVQMQLYTATACSGTFTQVYSCFGNTSVGLGYTPGTTYYLRISNNTSAANFTFNLCLSTRYPGTEQKIGINTTNPAFNLDVRGNAFFKDSTYLQGPTQAQQLEVNFLKISSGTPGTNKVLTSDGIGNTNWQNISAIPGQAWTVSGNNIYNSNIGNVGIGISNPGFPLNFADVPGDKISLWGDDPNGNSIGFGAQLGLLQIHSYQASDDIAFGYGSSSNFTEQMRIKGNGKVGIGESNPTTAKLVIGGTSTQEGLDLSSADQYANLRVIRNSLNSFDKDMYIGYESGPTSSLHLYSNNNETLTIKDNKIGIGEINPVFPLNFFSNNGDKIALWGNSTHGTNGGSIGFGVQDGLFQIHSNQLSDAIAFGYGSSSNFTEQMRIKGNGNVGIGTSNPGFPLNFADGEGDKISLWGNDPNGSSIGFGAKVGLLQIHSYQASDAIAFGYGSSINFTEQMRIKGNGNVGIGTINPGYKLDVVGDINASGQVRANVLVTTSDARFKQNISFIPNALNNLLQLRGTNYFFNTKAFPERNFSADKQMGVIAQEVEKVFPELVTIDKDGYRSVNYIGLIPVMIESIKEQQTQIEKQNQQIDKLTRLVNQLMSK